jgi:hypothetical protein
MKKMFKRLYVKWVVWLRYKTLKNSEELNDNQRICLSICRSLINHPDSKFLIAPLSGERFIKNTELRLFVILEGRQISITNHVYHYDVTLYDREWDRLTRLYDNKTEFTRQQYKEEVKSQIKNSLRTILDRVDSSEGFPQDTLNETP